MRLEIISTFLKVCPYITDGIKDRRYRSGYRVLPMASCSPVIHFTIKLIPELRVQQTLTMWDRWGTYIVTSVDQLNGVMEIIPLKRNYQKDKEHITIPKFIEFLPGPIVAPVSSTLKT